MFASRLTAVVFAFLVLIAGGCNTYESVQVVVRDAETGKSVAKAAVAVHYLYYLDPFHPRDTSDVSDEQGRTTIKVANYFREFDVSADGYIPLSLKPTQQDKNLDLWLYSLPEPSIEIIVPTGYRGPLLIDLNPSKSLIQEAPGKRHFAFRMSTSSLVHIDATPLLQELYIGPGSPHLTVRYEDGKSIPYGDYRFGLDDVALRWVSVGSEKETLYVIGTESDKRRMRYGE